MNSRQDWADDEDLDETQDLPPQQITTNKDGTKTIVTWRYNDDGKKVKTTRRIRTTVHKEVVNPRVAERKHLAKFGLSAKDKPGPALDTTTVGENIIFKPSVNWRKDAKEEKPEVGSIKDQLKDKKVKCRICNGEHFTARCPFKETMAPVGEDGAPADGVDGAAGGAGADTGVGALGAGKSSYVPPHLRNAGGAAASGGDRMGGKFERDDLATLRVTNVGSPFSSSALMPVRNVTDANTLYFRSPKWQKNKSSATCSSVSVASHVCSWPRTEKPEWRRALRSFLLRRGQMLRRRARRWMVMVSSI
jgi:translation initiation factor 3 subunit G